MTETNANTISQNCEDLVPRTAVVTHVEQVTDTEKTLTLRMKDKPLVFSPGQFVQVSAFGFGEAPFSVCSNPKKRDGFQVCIRAVGGVSNALHKMKPGDEVGIRGPYGCGFPLDRMKHKDLLCVAGGIGLAPLRSLITHVRSQRKHFGRVVVVYGAKTPARRLFRDDLAKWEGDIGMALHQIVDQPDDTWQGDIGVVTDPLKKLVIDQERTIAAVVGPPALFRFVAMTLFEKGMTGEQIYFSIERHYDPCISCSTH